MAIFIVMEPAEKPGADRQDEAVFVRDGFSLLAFVVSPLWLLWHRLWIEAALAVAAAMLLAVLGEAAGFGIAGSLLSLLVSLYFGFEGPALRLAALRRRGWREWGAVEADSLADAETRYLVELDGVDDGDDLYRAAPAPRPSPPRPSGPALGLLTYGGRS